MGLETCISGFKIFRHFEYVQLQGGVRTTDKNLAKIEVMSWNSPLDLDPQTPQGQAANSSCPFRWGPRDAGGVMEWSGDIDWMRPVLELRCNSSINKP